MMQKLKHSFILLFLGCTSLITLAQPSTDFVPEWAKQVVWYQIFPERFYNGDPTNDPIIQDQALSDPFDTIHPWQISPWESDWYGMQPWEKETGKGIAHQLQRRRYGGDLQGIINKLDYLKSLGISGIYLNPIFTAPSSHKYDAQGYHHVDPTFGPDPKGDRALIAKETPEDPSTWVWTKADLLALTLIEEAHKRGIRIIFDGVFNHLGISSFAFQDIKKQQGNSRFKEWFLIDSFEDSLKKTHFSYKGWFGVPTLPEINENKNGMNKGPKDYIFASTRRWMAPVVEGKARKGIDGWRLDVAFCVDHTFWKEFRTHIKAINPEAYITGEVFIDGDDKIGGYRTYLEGDEFDANMNYLFYFNTADFFRGTTTKTPPSIFDQRMKALRDGLPKGVNEVMQNLIGSHDTQRASSLLMNNTQFDMFNWGQVFEKSKGENPLYNTRKPTMEAYQKLKLWVLFQMTYIGAPMVYYGDEVGMWGGNDPCDRKPMVWKEFSYNNEAFSFTGKPYSQPDNVAVNEELLAWYKQVITLRNSHNCLSLGDFTTLLTDDNKQLYGYQRTYNKEALMVLLNNSGQPQTTSLTLKGKYKNLLDNTLITPSSITLKGYSGMVLQKIKD